MDVAIPDEAKASPDYGERIMYTYSPSDEEHIRIYGRTVRKDPLPLFWTASGIEFDTDATECYVNLECDYGIYEYYIRVEIDGALIQRFLLPRGRGEYCLFRNFPEGVVKTVSVLMETQPLGEENGRSLLVHGISADRILQPLIPKAHRIEFVGDSLTSGEGLTGASNISDWFAGIYGLTGHYALKVARYFDAEYSIVSQSGWGVYCGWDNNIYSNIPAYYEKICGVIADDEGLKEWDFDSWQPELVVVNLGTNDGGATTNPEWTDPDTGITYKQCPVGEPGGSPENIWDPESKKRFEDAEYDFLIKLRKHNPDAYILWVYGMCGPLMEPFIRETIERYKNETGDERVAYRPLPECPEEDFGAHFHPGPKNHAKTADIIIDFIEENGIL